VRKTAAGKALPCRRESPKGEEFMNGFLTSEAKEMLGRATTGMVNDALALLGFNGGISPIRPARGSEDFRVVGPAATVLFGSPRPGASKMTMYEAIRNSPPGSIMVVDGKGRDAHFTGDNQGECAKRQGLAAMVVYGGARDIAGYRAMGVPLYCTGSSTVDKPHDMSIVGHNVPIEVNGVTVRPGDIIVADEDGVVCIPKESISATIEKLKIIHSVEEAMERRIGISTDMLNGNFVSLGLQQVTPIDFFLPTFREETEFVFVEEITKTRPIVITASVRKFFKEKVVEIIAPQSPVFVERIGHRTRP
ncbi:MAG: RraA family protein, partial [Pseudomonadota bacterium]